MSEKDSRSDENRPVKTTGNEGRGNPPRGNKTLIIILIAIIAGLLLALVVFATPLRNVIWASKTAPEISLELVQGTGLWTDEGYYVFEVEAVVTGNPQPEIYFNRNDRFGETDETITVINLEPGESFMLVATAKNSLGLASGNLELYAVDLNADNEDDEPDEEEEKETTPPDSGTTKRPDLVITTGSPTVTPATVAPGGTVTVSSWKVKNQGTAAAGSFQNGFYLSTTPTITAADTSLAGNANSGLAVGAEHTWAAGTVTMPAGTAPGTYYIGILVDRNNSVTESNENNNFVSTEITVSAPVALPDLVITTGSPTVNPATVFPGGTVTLSSWTIKNQGEASSGAFQNGFYLSSTPTITTSDTYLSGNSNSSLASDADFTWGGPTLTIPVGTAPGTYYIGILVDRNNSVTESNENNNYVSTEITVSAPVALPDLVITTGSPTATPATVLPGGMVTLSSWTVKNQGTAPSGSFQNGFYLSTTPVITASDTYLSGNSNGSLAVGAEFTWGGPTLTIPAGTTPGTYYIGILVDRNNSVAESNETNNFVSTPITVISILLPLPDLVITTGSPTVTPLTVSAGGTVTLSSWTVKNQGVAPSGAFQNGFYLSTTPVITASDTYLSGNSNGSLAVGAEFNWGGPTLTIPAGTIPGTYYIGILVDRNNSVIESNEFNNYVSRQITVVP